MFLVVPVMDLATPVGELLKGSGGLGATEYCTGAWSYVQRNSVCGQGRNPVLLSIACDFGDSCIVCAREACHVLTEHALLCPDRTDKCTSVPVQSE
jgi:hypothetical protein